MGKIIIETSSFSVQAEKFKRAKQWWDSLTDYQQTLLANKHRIVTWEHVISTWEREVGR